MKKALLKTGKKYAARFASGSDYAKSTDNIASGLTSLTIGGFVTREGDGSTYEMALHSATNGNVGQSDFFIGFVTVTNEIVSTIGAKLASWTAGKTGVIPTLDQEYHIAASWDGSDVRVFVDGVFKVTYALSSGSFSFYTSGSPTRMGSSNDGVTYWAKCMNRDMRIYDRALSDDEVAQWAKEVSISDGGLIAHWDANQPSGTTLIDLAGNHNMTFYNSASFVTI
tara:strand:+ start:25284 stop:25958 length:675 start_codon:yes stop_codon:yes gene_type:complete